MTMPTVTAWDAPATDEPLDQANLTTLAPQAPGDRKEQRRKFFGWSVAIGLGLLLIAGQLVRPAFDDSPVQGPKGSSHSTTGNGLAGLAELASGFGRSVVRYDYPLAEIGPFAKHPIDGNATLVILDAEINPDDVVRIENFIRAGGTLVASVNAAGDWLERIPELKDYVASYTGAPNFAFGRAKDVQAQTVQAVGVVETGSSYALQVLGGSGFELSPDPTDSGVSTVVRESESVTAIRVEVGDGEVVAFTDASMLSNDLLDQGDNAAFALAVLGSADTPVVFAEEPHGYRAATDASGLPSNVRWFLGGLLIATLVLMWSRSRRNGPPEYPLRELAPARSQYLLSLSSEIDRLRKPRRLPGRRPITPADPHKEARPDA